MTPITYRKTAGNSVQRATAWVAEHEQKQRIRTALGVTRGRLPRVDDETLSQYYAYLSANLSLPFAACYPEPTTSRDKGQVRCIVVEVLDPARHMGDELDGLFCKTRKDRFEVNLPLIELEVAQDSPNFQLIEDYWYWFWNWR
jgi:hypothetical protein